MNTLEILDANTANLPEGLYLKLVNALKKDFEKNENKNLNMLNENNFTVKSFKSFLDEIGDFELEPDIQAECSCRFLNNITGKQELIEFLFNKEFRNEFYYCQETKDCKRIYICDYCDCYVKECNRLFCEECNDNFCLKCSDGNNNEDFCANCRPDLNIEHKNYQMIFN